MTRASWFWLTFTAGCGAAFNMSTSTHVKIISGLGVVFGTFALLLSVARWEALATVTPKVSPKTKFVIFQLFLGGAFWVGVAALCSWVGIGWVGLTFLTLAFVGAILSKLDKIASSQN